MGDPFRTVAIRERAGQAVGLGLLIASVSVISYTLVRPYLTEGRVVQAKVVRVGMYDTGEGSGGNLPILTVRLPNGSIREVTPSWAAVDNCMPGRSISLLQSGTALQVASPGCRKVQ